MDFFSLVLQPGDALRGCGRIRVDADGTWFEPDHAIPLVAGEPGQMYPRWPYAVRVEGHDPAAVPTGFDDRSIPGQVLIAGIWRDDSILATTTRPASWPVRDSHLSMCSRARKSPLSSPELRAAVAGLAPHKREWTFAFSSQWIDPEDHPHYSVAVCRVTPGLARWATDHPAVTIDLQASLLPAGVDLLFTDPGELPPTTASARPEPDP